MPTYGVNSLCKMRLYLLCSVVPFIAVYTQYLTLVNSTSNPKFTVNEPLITNRLITGAYRHMTACVHT